MTAKLVAISEIKIAPNRQRQSFDLKQLNELAESIKANGLFHAPVVRVKDDQLWLVSGERRLRAISDIHELNETFSYDGVLIPSGKLPCINLGDLTPLQAEEAELEENIRRADLSWQERASATSRLTTLRSGQANQRSAPLPTVADISIEVRGSDKGSAHETTRREIIVAKHLTDPEVRAAESVDAAFKILKRKEEVSKRTELAALVGKTFTAELHHLYNQDSREFLRACAADTFDVILTDPPYGMGADEFGDSGGLAPIGAHGYVDSYENWLELMKWFCSESFRVTKPRAHAYVFCDIDHFHELRAGMKAAGWLTFRTPFIWHKPFAMRTPWPEYGPQRKWECLLYACKGNRSVTKLYGDVLTYGPDSNLGHVAQKPVALFTDLLRRSVSPGDSILDPFAGTGGVFVAAHELKCKATGVEMDPASYAIAYQRLQELKANPELVGL